MSYSEPQPPRPRHPDITLHDLTESLLWPRLFEAARLALAPHRLLLALATTVAIGLIGSLSLIWSEAPSFGESLGAALSLAFAILRGWFEHLDLARPWALDLEAFIAGGRQVFVDDPDLAIGRFIVSPFLLGIPMLAAFLVGWAAIARSAAWEFGVGVSEDTPTVIAVSIRRLPTLLLAALGLPILAAVVALLLGLAGWLLLEIAFVNILGAVLWGGALLLALILVPLLAAWMIGFPLLAPAVMCEGPDAFEAAQRAMAYVLGRPLRYLLYTGTLFALGIVLVAVVALLLGSANTFATAAASIFTGETGVLHAHPAELEGSAAVASRVIVFWRTLLTLLLSAYTISLFASSSSVLYLLLRKLNDGQDPADLAAEIRTA